MRRSIFFAILNLQMKEITKYFKLQYMEKKLIISFSIILPKDMQVFTENLDRLLFLDSFIDLIFRAQESQKLMEAMMGKYEEMKKKLDFTKENTTNLITKSTDALFWKLWFGLKREIYKKEV